MAGEDFSDLGTSAPPSATETPAPAPAAGPPPTIQANVDAIINHESGGNPQAVGDGGLALGLGQMHSELRAKYGITPTSSPEDQRKAVTDYFTELWSKHKGNADDAVSEYHLGEPNFARDRNSPANLQYLAEHRKRLGGGAAPAAASDAGGNDFSDLGTAEPPQTSTSVTPTSTPDQAAAQKAGEPIPPSLSGKSMRDMSHEEVGRELNKVFGYAPDDWRGRYTAILGKTGTDALQDFFEGAANISHPRDFGDAFNSLLKVLHPIGAAGEATSELVYQAAEDSGFAAAHPQWAAGLAVAAGGFVGSRRLPGFAEGPAFPLKGTTATRTAAAETATAAAGATERAAAARAAGEAATTSAADEATTAAERGKAWTETQARVSAQNTASAERTAAQAQESAAAAERTASPSPENAARAREALTPADVTVEQGGQVAGEALEAKLAEVKEPVQGIYRAIEEDAANKAKVLDPAQYQGVHEQIGALEQELGPTLTGQAKQVLADLKEKIDGGERLTFDDLARYKEQLDTILPGKKPPVGATPKTSALYNFKWQVRDLMSGLLDGNEKEWFDVATAMWRDEVIPRQQIVALVKKSDPMTVVERLFGTGSSDKQAAMARRVMGYLKDDTTGRVEAIRQAFGSRMIRQATRRSDGALDPKKLVGIFDKMHDVVAENLLNEGQRSFFTVLRDEQTLAETTASAAKTTKAQASAVAREGRASVAEAKQTAGSYAREKAGTARATARETGKATTAAEKEAKEATSAAEAAKAEAEQPTRLARLMAQGLRIGTLGIAGKVAGVAHTTAGAAAEGVIGSLFLPADKLAQALADSKFANLLARALKTPFNSAVAPTLYHTIKRRMDESDAKMRAQDDEAA